MAGARDVFASFGAFGSTDMDDDDKIATAQVRPGDALEDMVYATFIAHHSEPDAKFPFAYLTPGAFDEAVTELVAALRPGEKVPRSATAAIAAAADANGDGVIQWQEYLFCAKELDPPLRPPWRRQPPQRERRRIDRRRFFREGYVVLVKNIRIRSRGDDDARAAVRLTRRS